MDFIDFYDRVTPTPVAKAAPAPWQSAEGERARARGVRTADEFAVVQVIDAEYQRNKCIGLTNGEVARRLRASPVGVDRIVDDLLLRGVIRGEAGMLGVKTLVPSKAG